MTNLDMLQRLIKEGIKPDYSDALIVLEVPHTRKPTCYSFNNVESMYSALDSAHEKYGSGDTIYEVLDKDTIYSMLDCDPSLRDVLYANCTCGDSIRIDDYPDTHRLYRADFLKTKGAYYSIDIAKYDAYIAYLKHDLSACYVYTIPEFQELINHFEYITDSILFNRYDSLIGEYLNHTYTITDYFIECPACDQMTFKADMILVDSEYDEYVCDMCADKAGIS